MLYKNAHARLTLGAMVAAAFSVACSTMGVPEELKSFDGYDVSREICDDVKVQLPKKSSHGSMMVVLDTTVSPTDLRPGEVRVVVKRDGKNYAKRDFDGMFSGGPFQTSDTYGAFESATDNPNWNAALIQGRIEILNYHKAKVISERPIMMNGQFPGLEVDFQAIDDANTQGKLRLYFVVNSASRSGQPVPRLYGVQAVGSKAFLELPQTKTVLDSLSIRTKS